MALPVPPELAQSWRDISVDLRRVVGESTYDIWLAPIEAEDWNGSVLQLRASSETRAWVAERFGRIIEACAGALLGCDVRVSFEPDGSPRRDPDRSPQGGSRLAADADLAAPLNPRYSFDQFIIGDGNRLAHAACLAVSELPGQAYNPLFLHSPPGLGKTHLLHAVGNYILGFGGGATVRYATVESFTNHFITSLHSHSVHTFKRAYRDVDVLLLDDVQFLASKVKTEEEFFHTFNALYETGRQLVLTCDRLPQELLNVEERLRERFESGLVANIQPPDFPTRVAILRKRAALDQIVLPDPNVLELIAERVTNNVRSLEGALIRVVAYHSLTGNQIDASLTAAVLDHMYPRSGAGSLSIAEIQEAVATHFQITSTELVSPARAARIAWPRQVAMYVSRELTTASLPEVGRAFGNRNHATVHYACKRVGERLHADSGQAAVVHELLTALTGQRDDRAC